MNVEALKSKTAEAQKRQAEWAAEQQKKQKLEERAKRRKYLADAKKEADALFEKSKAGIERAAERGQNTFEICKAEGYGYDRLTDRDKIIQKRFQQEGLKPGTTWVKSGGYHDSDCGWIDTGDTWLTVSW